MSASSHGPSSSAPRDRLRPPPSLLPGLAAARCGLAAAGGRLRRGEPMVRSGEAADCRQGAAAPPARGRPSPAQHGARYAQCRPRRRRGRRRRRRPAPTTTRWVDLPPPPPPPDDGARRRRRRRTRRRVSGSRWSSSAGAAPVEPDFMPDLSLPGVGSMYASPPTARSSSCRRARGRTASRSSGSAECRSTSTRTRRSCTHGSARRASSRPRSAPSSTPP